MEGIPVAVTRLIGADALERASFLRKVKREEKYQRSSLEALSKPPPSGSQAPQCSMPQAQALGRICHLLHADQQRIPDSLGISHAQRACIDKCMLHDTAHLTLLGVLMCGTMSACSTTART